MDKKLLNKAIGSIEPDDFMKTRIKMKVLSSHKRKFASVFVASLSCCIVIALLICLLPKNDIPVENMPTPFETHTDTSAPIEPLVNNEFQVLAYTCDNNMSSLETGSAPEISKEIVLNKSEVVLPEMTIKRGDYSEYTDSDGTLHQSYDCRLHNDSSSFKVIGNNIETIKYNSQNGEFSLWKVQKDTDYIESGNYYVAVMPLDEETVKTFGKLNKWGNYDFNTEKYIKTYWNTEVFKNLREKYFKGKSQDYKDYGIGCGTNYSMNREYKVGDETITVPIGQTAIHFTNPTQFEDFHECTNEFTITYDQQEWNGDYICIEYEPRNAEDEVMKYQPLKYEDLPGDIITVEVTFENGEVQKKTIETSFNEKGEIMMKLCD